MTPREILLKAADHIESGYCKFCCIALKAAAGYYKHSTNEVDIASYSLALAMLTKLYKGEDKGEGDIWFPMPSGRYDEDTVRISALRHTASMFE
jgi:hypothetical protein